MKIIFLFLAIVFFQTGCSSQKIAKSNSISEAVMPVPPADNAEFLYSLGKAKASSCTQAEVQARQQATEAMTQKLLVKMQAIEKSAVEECRGKCFTDEFFETVSKDLAAEALALDEVSLSCSDSKPIECVHIGSLNTGAARDLFLNLLSKNKDNYIRFKVSRVYDRIVSDFSTID